MTAKVVIEGSAFVSAPQLAELFRQISVGAITGFHVQALLEHRNPFVLQIHEHPYFSFTKESPFDGEEFLRKNAPWIVYNDEVVALFRQETKSLDAVRLAYTDVTHEMSVRDVIAQLPHPYETELWHVANHLRVQIGKGETAGPLKIGGKETPNVFFMHDVMLTVTMIGPFTWHLEVSPVEGTLKVGTRVFAQAANQEL